MENLALKDRGFSTIWLFGIGYQYSFSNTVHHSSSQLFLQEIEPVPGNSLKVRNTIERVSQHSFLRDGEALPKQYLSTREVFVDVGAPPIVGDLEMN